MCSTVGPGPAITVPLVPAAPIEPLKPSRHRARPERRRGGRDAEQTSGAVGFAAPPPKPMPTKWHRPRREAVDSGSGRSPGARRRSGTGRGRAPSGAEIPVDDGALIEGTGLSAVRAPCRPSPRPPRCRMPSRRGMRTSPQAQCDGRAATPDDAAPESRRAETDGRRHRGPEPSGRSLPSRCRLRREGFGRRCLAERLPTARPSRRPRRPSRC